MPADRAPTQAGSVRRRVMLVIFASLGAGCTVQVSDLVTTTDAGTGAPNLAPEVIAAIDERPIGGASLTTGTRGGGTYATAAAAGAVRVVSTLGDLMQAVSGETPAVVLVTEGVYEGSTASRTFEICQKPCDPAAPIATETTVSTYCTNGETISSVDVHFDVLHVGSHKTVIGLGAGALLRNVEVDLGGSTDVILRNLAIEDLAPDISNALDGLLLWPSDHVWIDHVTFRNISRAYLNIVSSWDQENNQALTVETGFITITHCDFDGYVANGCGQRSGFILGTSRNPGITIAHDWIHASRFRSGYLFGPGTWAHVFDNTWSDVDGQGLAVACGAIGLAQGNVFEATHDAFYDNDDGTTSWSFCSAGAFGKLYAPTATANDEANVLDAASNTNLNGQPTDGAGAIVPRRISDHDFEITVPVDLGTRTETYTVTLTADPSSVPAEVQANAGIGKMF